MPTDHRGGFDDRQSLPPARPPLREDHPEGSVTHPEAQASGTAGPDEHPDLLPKRQVLESQLPPRLEQRPHRPEDTPAPQSTRHRPYPLNTLQLKPILLDGLFGRHTSAPAGRENESFFPQTARTAGRFARRCSWNAGRGRCCSDSPGTGRARPRRSTGGVRTRGEARSDARPEGRRSSGGAAGTAQLVPELVSGPRRHRDAARWEDYSRDHHLGRRWQDSAHLHPRRSRAAPLRERPELRRRVPGPHVTLLNVLRVTK